MNSIERKKRREDRRARRSTNNGDGTIWVFEFLSEIFELLVMLPLRIITWPFRALGSLFDGF